MRVWAFFLVLLPLFAPAGAALMPRASSTPGTCYICYFEDNLGDDILSTTRDPGTETLSCVYQYETCKYSLTTGAYISGGLTFCESSAHFTYYLCPSTSTTGSALSGEWYQDYGTNFQTLQCQYNSGTVCDYLIDTGSLENTNGAPCAQSAVACVAGQRKRRRDNFVAVREKRARAAWQARHEVL